MSWADRVRGSGSGGASGSSGASDAFSVTPTKGSASSVTPTKSDASSVTPTNGSAFSVTPTKSDAFSVTPTKSDASSVTPTNGSASSVTPTKGSASSVTPTKGSASSAFPTPDITYTEASNRCQYIVTAVHSNGKKYMTTVNSFRQVLTLRNMSCAAWYCSTYGEWDWDIECGLPDDVDWDRTEQGLYSPWCDMRQYVEGYNFNNCVGRPYTDLSSFGRTSRGAIDLHLPLPSPTELIL